MSEKERGEPRLAISSIKCRSLSNFRRKKEKLLSNQTMTETFFVICIM